MEAVAAATRTAAHATAKAKEIARKKLQKYKKKKTVDFWYVYLQDFKVSRFEYLLDCVCAKFGQAQVL